MHTAIAAILLATAPASTSPPTSFAPFEVADAEVTARDGVVTLTAFDADGEVTAELATWTEDGVQQIDVTFADGLYLFASGASEPESNDAEEVSARLVVLETALPEVTDAEVAECGLGLLGLAAGAGGPWGVMAGVTGFALTCVKTIVEELQGEGEADEESGDE